MLPSTRHMLLFEAMAAAARCPLPLLLCTAAVFWLAAEVRCASV